MAIVALGWIALVVGANLDALIRTLKGFQYGIELLGQFSWPSPDCFLSLTALLLLFGTALAVGRPALRLFSFDGISLQEELLFSLGLGLGLLTLAVLFLGLAGHFTATAIRFVLILSASVAAILNCFLAPKISASLPPDVAASSKFWTAVITCVLTGLVILNFFGALGPEVLYDSLVYHLALPKLYLLNGRIFPTPYNAYSGIPFNSEMLYGVGLALGGESVAKLVPWGLGIATLAMIYFWVRKRSSSKAALLSALIFYSVPMVSDTTWHCYAELNWCFYGLLAIAAVTLGSEPERLTNRRAILVGILSGLCIGTKYNAVVIPIVIVGILVSRAARREISWLRLSTMTAIIALTATLMVAPWLIKNAVFYKNPVFPFFNDWFPHAPRSIDWRAFITDAGGRDLKATLTTLQGLGDLFSPLWPRLNTDDRVSLGYCFFLFFPWLFLFRWNDSRYRDISIALVLAAACWGLQTNMLRFFLYALPLLAILLGTAVAEGTGPGGFKNFTYSCAVIACLLNAGHTFRLWQIYGTWKVVFGRMTKSAFLSHEQPVYPAPPYAAIDFINRQTPSDSKMLFLYEARAFHCDRNFVATSPYAQNPIVELANASKDAGELFERLRGAGITHILLNQRELARLQARLPVSKKGATVLDEFSRTHLKSLFERRIDTPGNAQWVTVFKLV